MYMKRIVTIPNSSFEDFYMLLATISLVEKQVKVLRCVDTLALN